MERFANQTGLSAIFNFLEPLDNSLLHSAAGADKHDILRLLLDYIPDNLLADQNSAGNTPLIMAIWIKSFRAAAMLIRGIRNNALPIAMRRRYVNAVRHLLNEDLELVYQKNADQKSPLYLALKFEEPEIHKILFSLLPLEPSRIQGLPPIHGAIMHNHYDLAAQLLKKDVKLFAMTDSRGCNVFHLAAYTNKAQVFKLLGPETEYLTLQRDMNGDLPIHIASKMGYVDLIKRLPLISLDVNWQGQTALHVAAKYGRTSAVRYMLRHPTMEGLTHERDHDGNTALHLAAMHSQPAALIPLVLDESINPFHVNHQPMTALDIALDRIKREYTLRKVGNMNNHYFIYERTS
ncbi:hypothetical protein BT93_L5730 [Corymbia citriodora subsp. variegata]|uniref:Uncharacterized protein n=1 Tax=Corymbia citriodora subsp. variegata TaxID=360336 RepID=A0A8T0CRI5_CORYI|nr:hypothetical protein BT93_L5730 [Corymbia citriodora subsp. variegata]